MKMTLPETLRKRVVDRYEYMVIMLLLIFCICTYMVQWKESRGEEIKNVLNLLPPNLRTALFTETHQTMLGAVSVQSLFGVYSAVNMYAVFCLLQ